MHDCTAFWGGAGWDLLFTLQAFGRAYGRGWAWCLDDPMAFQKLEQLMRELEDALEAGAYQAQLPIGMRRDVFPAAQLNPLLDAVTQALQQDRADVSPGSHDPAPPPGRGWLLTGDVKGEVVNAGAGILWKIRDALDAH